MVHPASSRHINRLEASSPKLRHQPQGCGASFDVGVPYGALGKLRPLRFSEKLAE